MITEAAVTDMVRETATEWLDPTYTDLDGQRARVTVVRSRSGDDRLLINVQPFEDGSFSYPGERFEVFITVIRGEAL